MPPKRTRDVATTEPPAKRVRTDAKPTTKSERPVKSSGEEKAPTRASRTRTRKVEAVEEETAEPTSEPPTRRGKQTKSSPPPAKPATGTGRKAGSKKANDTTAPEPITKSKAKATKAKVTKATDEGDSPPKSTEGPENTDDDNKQFWLMKAEPDSRLEKGIDVAFSIDMLKERKVPEPWDGVRNPVARNHMKAMKKGDLAFFYHSNCKTPGVVGIMEIVQEHTIDESAFDPKHPYYDPKSSRDKPKWECVHVKFVRKFPEQVPLSTLRSFAKPGGPLEKMQMLVQSRLSVSAVKPDEWRFIMGLSEAKE